MGADLRIFKQYLINQENGRQLIVSSEIATIHNSKLIEKLQEEGKQAWSISDECGSIFEISTESLLKYKEDILKFDKTACVDLIDDSLNNSPIDYCFRCELSY